MATIMRYYRRCQVKTKGKVARLKFLIQLFCIFVMSPPLWAQAGTAFTVSSLMEQLKKGPLDAVTVNRLADANAVEAIPILKQKFALLIVKPSSGNTLPSAEELDKAAVASALVRLGDPSKEYWDFIESFAKVAAESDAPFPREMDASGKMVVPGKYTAEFQTWATDQKVSLVDAANNVVYGLPGRMIPLVMTGDRRGLPVLKRALQSRNYSIQYRAAQGLALLRDKESIPTIINLCEKAGAEFAPAIARTLVYFDDVRAQQAAARFITDPNALEMFRQQFATNGPRGMFQ